MKRKVIKRNKRTLRKRKVRKYMIGGAYDPSWEEKYNKFIEINNAIIVYKLSNGFNKLPFYDSNKMIGPGPGPLYFNLLSEFKTLIDYHKQINKEHEPMTMFEALYKGTISAGMVNPTDNIKALNDKYQEIINCYKKLIEYILNYENKKNADADDDFDADDINKDNTPKILNLDIDKVDENTIFSKENLFISQKQLEDIALFEQQKNIQIEMSNKRLANWLNDNTPIKSKSKISKYSNSKKINSKKRNSKYIKA